MGAGCERDGAREKPERTLSATDGFQRGDRVVVEARAGEFYEATLLEVSSENLRVQAADGESKLVAHADAYAIGAKASKGKLGSSGFAICPRAERLWVPCRIQSRSGPEWLALGLDGKTFRVAAKDVLRPTALTQLNIKSRFQKADARAAFLAAAAKFGAPARPKGWVPRGEERVLARTSDGWYAARIHEIEEDGFRVRLRGDNRETKVGREDVVPEPPYPVTFARGDFALMRPLTETEPWIVVQVKTAQPELTVLDVHGELHKVEARYLVPMSRSSGQKSRMH